MKKLFMICLAAAALAACSKEENPEPQKQYDVVSFEASEGMIDMMGNPVVLGDVEVLGFTGGKYKQVFWGNSVPMPTPYDNFLCMTADENLMFGTYYTQTEYGDMWGGFALSANAARTATTVDYANYHFSAWASKGGANGTSNCAIGYDGSYGNTYGLPTIELVEARRVSSCYLANSAITYPYTPSLIPDGAPYYYKVIVVGELDAKETGRVECMLINGASRVEDWTKFDLSTLGEVDVLKFIPASNDANSVGILAPAFFAVDEIAFERPATNN